MNNFLTYLNYFFFKNKLIDLITYFVVLIITTSKKQDRNHKYIFIKYFSYKYD